MSAADNGKSKYLAKIGDLGLGKVVRQDQNYYTSSNKSIPVKWYFFFQLENIYLKVGSRSN